MRALEHFKRHDDDLRVEYFPGTGEDLVVSFGGVREGRKQAPTEFWGSINEGGKNHMLFVGDQKDAWYNGRAMFPRIQEMLRSVKDFVQPAKTFTIGNSMGAYGACVFADTLQADAALAFCPQQSLDPSLVSDRRWKRYAVDVDTFDAPSIAETLNSTTRYVCAHGLRGLEREQARATPIAPNLRHYLFRTMYHSVAAQLKSMGVLADLIGAFLRGTPQQLDDAMIAAGADIRGVTTRKF